MRTIRLITWALITLMLMYGGGVFTSLHKLSHHTHPTIFSVCPSDHTTERGESTPTPSPIPADDDHCAICLGLSGLHLAPAPPPLPVVSLQTSAPCVVVTACTPILSRVPCVRSARAPPIC